MTREIKESVAAGTIYEQLRDLPLGETVCYYRGSFENAALLGDDEAIAARDDAQRAQKHNHVHLTSKIVAIGEREYLATGRARAMAPLQCPPHKLPRRAANLEFLACDDSQTRNGAS